VAVASVRTRNAGLLESHPSKMEPRDEIKGLWGHHSPPGAGGILPMSRQENGRVLGTGMTPVCLAHRGVFGTGLQEDVPEKMILHTWAFRSLRSPPRCRMSTYANVWLTGLEIVFPDDP